MKLKIYILIVLFLIVETFSFAQKKKLDSLITVFEIEKTQDSSTIYLLVEIYEIIKFQDIKTAKKYVSIAEKLSQKLDYKSGLALSLNCRGNVLEIEDKYDSAQIYFEKALKIYTKINHQNGIAKSLGNIGNSFLYRGKYKIAIEYYFKAIDIQNKINDEFGRGNNYNNLGVAYYYLQNYNKAEEYWLYALNSFQAQGNMHRMSYSLNNLGMIANNIEDYQNSISYYEQALEILTDLNDKKGMASALNNIAESYYAQKKYKQALEKYNQSLELKNEINDKRGLAIVLNNIGKVQLEAKDFKSAIENYNKSKHISKEIGFIEKLKDVYENLSDVYEKTNKIDSALKYQKLFASIKDSIYINENTQAITEMGAKYLTEKKSRENELLKKDIDLKKATIAQQQMMEYGFLIGIIMLLFIIILVFSQFRVKKKANQTLTQQNTIIEENNNKLNQLVEEIEGHKKQLEKKNHDIVSSIQYAKRIQEAILPNETTIADELPNSFILYKPKDIVSGDFYWIDKMNEKVFFTAVDCTGHGVPGAFMSIIGFNGLNKATHENFISSPGAILDFLDSHVKKTLQKSNKNTIIKDGMDMALCSWNPNSKVLEYAGAYNSMYVISKYDLQLENVEPVVENGLNLYEIKANKQPIGFSIKDKDNYKNHTLKLNEGDVIYIFTDGFADQFGGPSNRKFMSKNMKKMFLEHAEKPLTDQLEIYDQLFMNWRGENDQLDDICIIGMKV